MLDQVRIVCARPGGDTVPLSELDGAPRFATAAVGGFADCTFTLKGDQRRKVPYLSIVRILYGDVVLYEGQVEDADPAGSGDDLTTTVTCFGLRNLLAETTVRRIWSKRDLEWKWPPTIGVGGSLFGGSAARTNNLSLTVGQLDITDATKTGVLVAGNGVSIAADVGEIAELFAPSGVTLVSLLGAVGAAGLLTAILGSSANGTVWTVAAYAAGAQNIALAAGTTRLRVGAFNQSGGAITPTAASRITWTDIRVLGTSLTEDTSGGFYGGTILRDLIGLVPGLTVGLVEDGSDFTIQAIERAVRDTALSVVEEVAGYYTREWAVWESGRFDWKTRQLDQPDWLLTIADCSGLSIKGSLDGIARTVYVLYTDAASGLDAEASSAATAQRNPYVKQGRAKDLLVKAGFPMTANTSAQLATRIAGDVGQWVPVEGTITIPATRLIPRVNGAAAPAAMIRAGDNIAITDLPKTDLFQQGRDGETLFHIVGTNCDLKAGTITLELEGQASRTDVILARLAAATRTLTG